jgi:hypothetical protein
MNICRVERTGRAAPNLLLQPADGCCFVLIGAAQIHLADQQVRGLIVQCSVGVIGDDLVGPQVRNQLLLQCCQVNSGHCCQGMIAERIGWAKWPRCCLPAGEEHPDCDLRTLAVGDHNLAANAREGRLQKMGREERWVGRSA